MPDWNHLKIMVKFTENSTKVYKQVGQDIQWITISVYGSKFLWGLLLDSC